MRTPRLVITQGEHAVSQDREAVITTVLGSCVACCLWDPLAAAGGMNHMLLAGRAERGNAWSDLAGVNAMELLINDLLKLGAARDRLQAKVFGGARMVSGLSDIGEANAAFTLEFLARENIACVGKSLGGEQARRLEFWPATGIARQKSVRQAAPPPPPRPPAPAGNELELF
jgi:chemotaxis protein CheD